MESLDNSLRTRNENYRTVLKELTIMSDMFMRVVLKDARCTEYILQVIMQRKDLHVIDQDLQDDYKNLQGRSAILDCVVRDADGKIFDVEIQQDAEGASPKRARYHSGLMDMNILDAGQNFDELPETYVIFITDKDTLGYDFPIYHIERIIKENGKTFPDSAYIIYVNGNVQDNTELGHLIHDLHCKNAEEFYSDVLARRVRELKETREGEGIMCKEMDKIYNWGESSGITKGITKGITIGREEEKKEMARSLANMGMPLDKIAEAAKVDVEQIQAWVQAV